MIKNKITRLSKFSVIIFIILLFVFIIAWVIINRLDYSQPDRPVEFGVTFSHKYAAENLGLDWTEVYWAVLNDLQVKKIRLIAYWDTIEAADDQFNFNDLDWMLSQAAKKDVSVILVIGRRVPRWPECHEPDWLSGLDSAAQNKELLSLIKKIVTHCQKYDNITAWQVENEPYLNIFGECPESDESLLTQEVALVRELDGRPVVITDAGELSNWRSAAAHADIFGTTMYKTVWNKFIGFWRYYFPPVYYYYKTQVIKEKNPRLLDVIVSELQAEPWIPDKQDITLISLAEQYNSFDLYDFENNLDYVRRAGFHECYLWGVEWWYWLKTVKNEPSFWRRAQEIWQKP